MSPPENNLNSPQNSSQSSSQSSSWQPRSWRDKKAEQLPLYKDQDALARVSDTLTKLPPLVFGREADLLRKRLAQTAEGKGFLLQGGDCAESFKDQTANYIRDTFKVLMQMAVVLTFAGGVPVIKVGRMAGQYAKPRSQPFETLNGQQIPSYKGDNINGMDTSDREPNPERMLQGYHVSAASLNLLRAFAEGGLADLSLVHRWMLDFVRESPERSQFEDIAERIGDAMTFMKACSLNVHETASLRRTEFYTSHEALLLPFEEAMTRRDSLSHRWFDCSAHMVWIGDRTRHPEGAHVEFCRGIANPIGIKCGPSLTPSELITLLEILNPDHTPGRIVLIVRMGHDKIAAHLPDLIRTLQNHGRAREVVWSCDPMHGNTVKTDNNYKTRHFLAIMSEIEQFFHINSNMNNHAGGIHLELTGQDVTECSGGAQKIDENSLGDRYHTVCDPRLNAQQSLEVAFRLATYIRQQERRTSAS